MVKDAYILSGIEQLSEIIELSSTVSCGVAIYKHSTHCGVSMFTHSMLRTTWDFNPNEMPFYYLDLIRYRSISNKIEELFSVRHESPQVLIIKDGKCIYNASHSSISVDSIKDAVHCYA